MAIIDESPRASDGRFYSLDMRYASLYTWGRPPMPGRAAEILASVVDKYGIETALVLGSCCPSVLAALSFGNRSRRIKMVDMQARWIERYYEFMESDVTSKEREYPEYNYWLPADHVEAMIEWDWSPSLGKMIFVDVPGSSRLLPRDLKFVVDRVRPRIVVMGFMENWPGPIELEEHLRAVGWEMAEALDLITNHETGEYLRYRIVIAVCPPCATEPLRIDDQMTLRQSSENLASKSTQMTDLSSSDLQEPFSPACIDQLRERYKPEKVKMLFVAESPPKSPPGASESEIRFFYNPKQERWDNLYRSVMKSVFPEFEFQKGEKDKWLTMFKGRGYFLIDATDRPVNHLQRAERRQELEAVLEAKLSEIKSLISPATPIILVKKNIFQAFKEPLRKLGYNVIHKEFLPFPSQGHQHRFIELCSDCIRRAR